MRQEKILSKFSKCWVVSFIQLSLIMSVLIIYPLNKKLSGIALGSGEGYKHEEKFMTKYWELES